MPHPPSEPFAAITFYILTFSALVSLEIGLASFIRHEYGLHFPKKEIEPLKSPAIAVNSFQTVRCPECGRQYRRVENFMRHVQKKHPQLPTSP